METSAMCRICLAEDVRMHFIAKTNLQEVFEKLTVLPFETKDSRSLLVCYICHARLQNCHRLRMSCLQTEELYTEMQTNNMLKQENVKPIVSGRLTVTTVVHLTVIDDIQEDTAPGEHTGVGIKTESPNHFGDVVVKQEEYEGAPVPKKPKIAVQNNTKDTTGSKLKKNEQSEVILKESIVINKITVAEKPITTSKILNIKKCEENIVTSVCNNVREEKSNTTQRAIETVNSTLCSKNKPFSCDTCKKSFSSKSHLKDHIPIHTGEKPYECNVCKKCFIQKGDLKKHIRIHTGEKPYECNVCKKCFIHKHVLNDHIRTHTGEKPYECNVCKKCFIKKGDLKKHIRTHTGEKPHQCNVCKKCFSQKIHLKDHMYRIHTGEKPYQCNVCKKCFIHKHVLNYHIRTHTGEKPYQCNVCKKCFSRKIHLKIHIRTHSGEKPYQCNVCKKCFNQKINLKTHIRTHTGEKPYQCNICEKSFSDKRNLIKHIQVHSR